MPTLLSKLQKLSFPLFASDEMSETSDYNKREKLCQVNLCTIRKLFVELPFSTTEQTF
jgi:hypothetical protein